MKFWDCVLWALRLLALASVIAAGIIAALYIPSWSPSPPANPEAAFTRAEFITIILTAVTVILAALAIVLALAGVVGYVQIKSAAEAEARKAAEARAEEVAARVAEQMAIKVSGRDAEAGNEFARAAGGTLDDRGG